MSGTPSVPGAHTVIIIMFHILPLLVTCFVCSIVGPLSYLPLLALFGYWCYIFGAP